MTSIETVAEQKNITTVMLTVVPVIQELSLQGWADRINAATAKEIESMLHKGQVLIAAKKALLRHGLWEKLFKKNQHDAAAPVRFSVATAKMYMAIAAHPVLSNRNHGNDLPPNWRTLYELTHLPTPVLEAHLALGVVHPELTRAEAIVLCGTPQPLPPPRVSTSKGSPEPPAECDYEAVGRVESLQEDEVRLRKYATEVAAELRAPLQVNESGFIISGVWYLPSIPAPAARSKSAMKPQHSCPTCGHVHGDCRERGAN